MLGDGAEPGAIPDRDQNASTVPSDTVIGLITEVAVSMGFTHMGRFSAAYRRCFGESPSETLRRRRKRI